ncbi:MAG: hypothetical protein EZS28_037003 [Streblomastix strix]|uniref:Uncharacterized protein n=1 Tax=Streblomastix strix TaxID=222440 RepID=A0A5J4UB97_9EUKA|nr:MAG: hypothetical protein EZS28_037003 [Streblomastix strix]
MHHWWHQRTTAGDLASSKPQIVMELKNKEDKQGLNKQMTEYDEYVNEQEGYQQDDLNVEQKDNIEQSDEDDYEEYYEDDDENAEDIKGSIKLDDKQNQLTNLNNGNKEEDVAKSAVSTNSANFIIPPPIPIITASQINSSYQFSNPQDPAQIDMDFVNQPTVKITRVPSNQYFPTPSISQLSLSSTFLL